MKGTARTRRARRRGGAAAVAVLLAATVMPAAVAAADVPTCDGVPATIVGTPEADTIMGTDGRDVVVAGAGDDIIKTFDGDDMVCAGPGDDRIWGGRGRDLLDGDDGDDRLIGGPGPDHLIGSHGDDVLRGMSGNDRLHGGPGDDHLFGGRGSDRILPKGGTDSIDGGAGVDWIDYSYARSAVTVELAAGRGRGSGRDTIVNVENVRGSSHSDTIAGDEHANLIVGSGGDDTITGGGGDDEIRGGAGDDVIRGNAGFDSVIGNAGHDECRGEAERGCEPLPALGPPGAVAPPEWGATADYDGWAQRYTPNEAIAIHYGGTSHYRAGRAEATIADEMAQLREWEQLHLGKGWFGLAYGWGVGQSGTIYRIRGWNRYGAHSGDLDGDRVRNNEEIIPIVWIGGGEQVPTMAARRSIRFLRSWLEDQSGVPLPLYGHRELGGDDTTCPGDIWIRILTRWEERVELLPPGRARWAAGPRV